jgi:hypothetical protein
MEGPQQKADLAKGPPLATPGLIADKPKPFVLVRADSAKQEEFASFAQALGELQNGDTVEVHGNGPFQIGPVLLKDKGLNLRAGSGYRPRFIPADTVAEKTWFDIQGREVRIEGCHFQLRCDISTILMNYSGPALHMADCFVWQPRVAGDQQSLFVIGSGSYLDLTNNLFMSQSGSMMLLQAPGGQNIRLKHNTIFLTDHLIDWNGKASFNPTTVNAQSNIIATGIIHFSILYSSEASGRLHWQGWHNLYVGQNTVTAESADGQVVAKGLEAWNKYWGNQDIGSKETDRALLQWDKPREQSPEVTIESFKRVTKKIRQQYALPNLGPDWDLVGPGEAYVRGVAAQDSSVLGPRHRAAKPPGGPFVLLREDQVLRGCATLREAVDAAASGDTIEIRSDDKFPGGNVESPGKSLTLRAGFGYRPMLEDGMSSNVDWVAVEGIHFPRGKLCVYGRIRRLANCSFDKTHYNYSDYPFMEGVPQVATAAEQPTEIINCVIPNYAAELHLAPGTKSIIRNSILGKLRLIVPSDGEGELQLEHCVVWSGLESAFLVAGRGKLAISARDTFFSASGPFFKRAGDLPSGWRWQGSANTYRIGPRSWRIFYEESDKDFSGLEAWRMHWKSDANSVEIVESLDLDPLQWRLLPTSPGYRESPDGKDMGADVDRIAVTANTAKKSE